MVEDTLLLTYFGPKHLQTGGVMLNWATIVGFMQSGKTTMIKTIIKAINEKYKDLKQINISTQYPQNIYNLSEELITKIKDRELINIFIDDAAWGASSKKYSQSQEANWFYIRHYFEETVGVKKATLNVFYAIQRYKSLQNVLRSSPLLMWKAIPIRDPFERKEVGYLTRRNLKLIDKWAWDVYMKGDIKTMEQVLVVPSSGQAYVIRIPMDTTNDFIFLPPPKTGCILCYERMHEDGITYTKIAEWVGKGMAAVQQAVLRAKTSDDDILNSTKGIKNPQPKVVINAEEVLEVLTNGG